MQGTKDFKTFDDIFLAGKIDLVDMNKALKDCPAEFKNGSEWSMYAAKCICGMDLDTNDWKWKIPVGDKRGIMMGRFVYLICRPMYRIEDRICVGGWMLSEMLIEIPEYSKKK